MAANVSWTNCTSRRQIWRVEAKYKADPRLYACANLGQGDCLVHPEQSAIRIPKQPQRPGGPGRHATPDPLHRSETARGPGGDHREQFLAPDGCEPRPILRGRTRSPQLLVGPCRSTGSCRRWARVKHCSASSRAIWRRACATDATATGPPSPRNAVGCLHLLAEGVRPGVGVFHFRGDLPLIIDSGEPKASCRESSCWARSGVSGSIFSTSSPFVRWLIASRLAERSMASWPASSYRYRLVMQTRLGVVMRQQFGLRLHNLGKLFPSTCAMR